MNPITFDRVELRYGSRVVISGLSGVLAPGSLTAVIGPNGSGKTTLLRAIAGLHPLRVGAIDLGGLKPADIALLAQRSHLDRSFPVTCMDLVALATPGLGVWRSVSGNRRQKARDALQRVGLKGLDDCPIQALSAGQFQRVLFARTIVQDASLILLDEPFTAVDEATTGVLLSVIGHWHVQGRIVAAVLHDLDMVRCYFPQTLDLTGQHPVWTSQPGAPGAALYQAA